MLQQDYGTYNVRSAAILTNAYVAGNIIGNDSDFSQDGVHLKNQLELYIFFTLGSLTDALVKIEFSPDGTNYVQETDSSITNGVSTDTLLTHKLSASGNYRIAIPIKDRYIRVSVEGEGTVTSSLMSITAVIGIC